MFSDVGIMPAAITLDAVILMASNRKWDQELSKNLEAGKSTCDSNFTPLTTVSLSCICSGHELKYLEMEAFLSIPVTLSILFLSPFFASNKAKG